MNIDQLSLSMEQLRCLIGTRVEHQGVFCEIIEVLEDGPALVLQACQVHSVIQADQHGEAHRRVPPTRTVPILSPDRRELSKGFLALEIIDELTPHEST